MRQVSHHLQSCRCTVHVTVQPLSMRGTRTRIETYKFAKYMYTLTHTFTCTHILFSIFYFYFTQTGNSGGPVVNSANQVIGVAFQSLSDEDIENIGNPLL